MSNSAMLAFLLVAGALTPGVALGQGAMELAIAGPQPHFVAAWAPKKEREAERSAVLAGRVSLELRDVSLDAALKALTNQAGLRITYSRAMLPAGKRVTISARDVAVVTAMTEMLFRSGLDVVVDRDGALALVPCRHPARPEAEVEDTGVIVGRVTEVTGSPLHGATVSVEGTRLYAATDAEGRYTIRNVPSGTYTVRARYIGYAALTATVAVGAAEEVRADFALEKSVQKLDEVVTVTPGGMQTQVKALPTPISVITAADIQAQQPQTIQDVIRQAVPTAVAFDVPIQPTQTLFSVRGVTSLAGGTPMKIFVDGVEAARFGSMPVDPASIDRIEVIRGPQAAAVYGSDAAGGIIQIFTKRGPGNFTRPQVEIRTQAGILQTPYDGFGGVLRHQYTGSVGGGGQEVSYNFGGDYTRLEDWLPGGSRSRQSSPSLYGSIRYEGSSFNADLHARYARNSLPTGLNPDLMTTGFVPLSRPEFAIQDWVNAMFGARVTAAPVSWWQNTLTLGFNRSGFDQTQYRRRLTTPGDTLFTLANDDARKISVFYNSSVSRALTEWMGGSLTAGIDHSQLDANFSFTPQALNTDGTINVVPGGFLFQTRSTVKNTGYFAQGQLNWHETVFVTAGLRAEENTSFGRDIATPVQPRAGVSFVHRIGQTTVKLRAAYGRAIRPPSPGFAVTAVGVSSVTLGNSLLKPERQQGWDAGFDLLFGSWASLSVTTYDQVAHDLIALIQVPSDTLPTNQYQNLGRVANKGLEIEGAINLHPLQVKAQYGYVHSRVEDLGPSAQPGAQVQVGDRPLGQPPHSAGASLTLLPVEGTTVTAGVTYVGEFRQTDVLAQFRCLGGTAPCRPTLRDYVIDYPGFTKVNFSVTQRITQQLSAFAAIDNLTNSFASEGLNSFSVTGRQTMVGLHARL